MTDTLMSDDTTTPTSTTTTTRPSKKAPSDANVNKNKDGSSLPWVEKYRPSRLDDLISHKDIIQTITNLINANKLPHLLLYGPPGTGKTSTILAMARRLYGDNYGSQILELNASDDRGIDVVREQIKDFASSRAMFNPTGFKLILLDEADAMTKHAQFALRRVIEKYTRNTRFCLICNYVNKIIPALQSRCTRFRFQPLDREQQEQRLNVIVKQEGVNITPDGMRAIIALSDGDMRKCLNVLQSCHVAYPIVNEASVYQSTGNPLPSDIRTIMNILMNNTMQDAVDTIGKMQIEKGLSLADIVRYLSDNLAHVTLPPHIRMTLLSDLADLEYRLSFGTSEKLQLASLVGIFCLAKEEMVKYADKTEK